MKGVPCTSQNGGAFILTGKFDIRGGNIFGLDKQPHLTALRAQDLRRAAQS